MSETRYLLVGEVIKPHGVRGELGVRPVTSRPEVRFAQGETLLFGPDEDNLRPVKVERSRPFKRGYLLVLDTVGDREGAERVRDWGLYIDEETAEPLDEDEFYHHQLIGLRVVDERMGEVGEVVHVAEIPGQELLEVARPGKGRFYLPLVEEFVDEIDLEEGVMRVRIPAELTEL